VEEVVICPHFNRRHFVLWQDPGQELLTLIRLSFLILRKDQRGSNIQKLSEGALIQAEGDLFAGSFDRDWRNFILVEYSNFLDMQAKSPKALQSSGTVEATRILFPWLHN
jgi:hypothetical protein